jgi:hypothetical protein
MFGGEFELWGDLKMFQRIRARDFQGAAAGRDGATKVATLQTQESRFELSARRIYQSPAILRRAGRRQFLNARLMT